MNTSIFFRAPHCFTEEDTCHHCGRRIRSGEIIAEFRAEPLEYIHEGCAEQMREDQMEVA